MSILPSVLDFDVSVIHITTPLRSEAGHFRSVPKLAKDVERALDNGRPVICLPGAKSFRPQGLSQPLFRAPYGDPVYDWLGSFGVGLQDNAGNKIKPSGAGRAEVLEQYLSHAPEYHQIILQPETNSRNKLAVVDETEIAVGLEHDVGNGMLVILLPPTFSSPNFANSMDSPLKVAQRYDEKAQGRVPIGDLPDWLPGYLPPRAIAISEEIAKLEQEKAEYDRLAYALYGTGDDLELSVAALLSKFDLALERQPPGANIDWEAMHKELKLGFGVDVTGT